MLRSRRPVALLCALALAALSLTACGKKGKGDDDDDDAVATDAPPAPAVGTIAIDLSVSGDGQDLEAFAESTGSAALSHLTGATGINYAASMIFIAVININISAQLSIPVFLLKQAALATPKESAPGTYVWSFEGSSAGRTHKANFTGVKLGEGAYTWSMRVTSTPADANGCCTDFEFFSGASDLKGTGSWQIFDPRVPATPAKLFAISYTYASATSKSLTYTVNGDRPATEKFGNGSSIVYAVEADARSVTYHDSAETGNRTVAWSKSTKAGSMTDPAGTKICWASAAEQFANVTCP